MSSRAGQRFGWCRLVRGSVQHDRGSEKVGLGKVLVADDHGVR